MVGARPNDTTLGQEGIRVGNGWDVLGGWERCSSFCMFWLSSYQDIQGVDIRSGMELQLEHGTQFEKLLKLKNDQLAKHPQWRNIHFVLVSFQQYSINSNREPVTKWGAERSDSGARWRGSGVTSRARGSQRSRRKAKPSDTQRA